MSEVGAAIAQELRRVLRDRNLSATAAAKQLKVSRQSLHAYLSGKSIPRRAVLTRAVALWDCRIVVDGNVFTQRDFPKQDAREIPDSRQMTLEEMFNALRPEDFRVTMKKSGEALQIVVSLAA